MKAMKWVPDRVLIVFLLVSLYVTSSHQNTDQNSEFNVTKRVETNDHEAKVFYKHTWPVRVLSLENYMHTLSQFQVNCKLTFSRIFLDTKLVVLFRVFLS